MKWTYGIQQKLTAAGILAAIMALILFNNLSERRRFKKLEESISSIYQDRLLVESYIFKLYNNLQQQNDCLLGSSEQLTAQLNDLKQERQQLLSLYAKTYLTPEEKEHFEALKATLARFDQHDASLEKTAMNQEAIEHLNALSTIQTDEGASLYDQSESLILGSLTSSQLEMGIIIFLGIVIQALVFSSKSLKPKPFKQHHLN